MTNMLKILKRNAEIYEMQTWFFLGQFYFNIKSMANFCPLQSFFYVSGYIFIWSLNSGIDLNIDLIIHLNIDFHIEIIIDLIIHLNIDLYIEIIIDLIIDFIIHLIVDLIIHLIVDLNIDLIKRL